MPKALLRVTKELIAEAALEGVVHIHEVRDLGDCVEMTIEGVSLPEVVSGERLPEVRAVITQNYRTIDFEKI